MHSVIKMGAGKNICSFCNCSDGKFYHLEESIRAPNELRFGGHTDLQAVLEKILNKKGKLSKYICLKCRDKLHGIYSFTHQHTESEKIFHQITDVTVRMKKLKTFFILTNLLKTEFETIIESGKDLDSPECSSTLADIECGESAFSELMVKNECFENFEGTDLNKARKNLSVGLLGGEYSNSADGRSVEQKKIDTMDSEDSEQFTNEDEIFKEERIMQEGNIFEAKAKRHLLDREQTKFLCDICGEVFATVSCFTEHTKIVHENDSHDFNQADAEHNTKKEGHIQRFNNKTEFVNSKNYFCDECEKKYKCQNSLRVHKQSHSGAVFKCDQCNAKYKYKESLSRHKHSHAGVVFKCDQCHAKFKRKDNLRVHKQSHAGAVFKCDAKYKSKESLSKYKESHVGCFKCDQCDAKYKHKESLSSHKQSHAGVVFKCDQCDAKYKTKRNLNRHKQSHADAAFKCDQCDAKYKSKESLRVHKHSHKGKVFKCDQCDAKYKGRSSLRAHKQSHADAVFKCDQCDAKYKYKEGLIKHKPTHAGVVFKCDQCDAKFKYKESLRVHKQSHAGVEFKCDQCDAKYNCRSNLCRHKQSHAGVVFKCDQCHAKYETSGSLRRHKISHTGVKVKLQ